MRFCVQLASVVLVAVSFVALPGCGSQTPTKKAADKPAAGHFEGDGHDHSKDASKDSGDHKGHDHEKEGEHK